MYVAVAGHLASGKTSLAVALARELSADLASFGSYVRELVSARGEDANQRATLQRVGQSLVLSDPGAFFADFMSSRTWRSDSNIIFDGVRHLTIWNALCEHAKSNGTPAHLVFLQTDTEVRRKRLLDRSHSRADIETWQDHQMERDLAELMSAATLILDGAHSLGDNVRKVQATLASSS